MDDPAGRYQAALDRQSSTFDWDAYQAATSADDATAADTDTDCG